MTEKKKGPSTGSIVKTFIIVGGITLMGWGVYELVKTLKGGMNPQQLELYNKMADEYFSEVKEYDDFWKTIYPKGYATPMEQQHLDFMAGNISEKEKAMDQIGGQTWLSKLNTDMINLARTIGLWYILPGVLTAGSIFAAYRLAKAKKWPLFRKTPPADTNRGGGSIPPTNSPPPTPIVDPVDNSIWPDYQSWSDHVFLSRPATTDPTAIRAAKSAYDQMSGTTRAMVEAQIHELNLTPPPSTDWLPVAELVLQGVAVAAMIVATCGAATPLAVVSEAGVVTAVDEASIVYGVPLATNLGQGLSEYNILTEADTILAQTCAKELVGAGV